MAFEVHQSEIDDFEAVLKGAGYSTGDFDIKVADTTKQSNTVFPIAGIVTVTAKASEVSRSFNAGHGTAWVVEFEKDLKQGQFN